MSIAGVPSLKFAQPITDSQTLKEAYDSLFAAWDMITIHPIASTGNLENTITRQLYDCVQCEQMRLIDANSRQFCYSFWLAPSVTDGRGNLTGNTDMQIQFGNDPRQRFIFEAKLLNKPKSSNVGAYVGDEGMGRFISGKKYAISVSEGGMIGYVLDADIGKAKSKVTEKIEQERSSLGMSTRGTLKNSSLRDDVYETSHIRHTKTPFTIYHIFLPVRN